MLSRIAVIRFYLLLVFVPILQLLPSAVFGQDTGSMEGAWLGNLRIIKSSLVPGSDAYRQAVEPYSSSSFKIIIKAQATQVFLNNEEVKPGVFRAENFKTNGIIFATDTGDDTDGSWVESWSFLVTQKDPETIIVVFSRMVNNVDLPLDRDISKFFSVAAGELRRTSQ